MQIQCPFCAEIIDSNDAFCRYCSNKLLSPENTPNSVSRRTAPLTTGHKSLLWIAVLIPLWGEIPIRLLAQSDTAYAWLFFLLNVIFFSIDEKWLKKSGYEPPTSWWILLIPVYLWKRGTVVGDGRGYFIVWWVAFVLSCLIF